MSTQKNRLDSWKEIAQYLGRNERTVQRWELERGLPVHRLPGARRGGVFAFTEELDLWLSQTTDLEENEPGEPNLASQNVAAASGVQSGSLLETTVFQPYSTPSAPQSPFWKRWWLFIASAIAFLFIIVFIIFHHVDRHALQESFSGKRPLLIKRLDFRRGMIRAARFRPDGANIVYAAIWRDSPTSELYETALDQPESSPLRSPDTQLLAISRSSTLAVLLNPQFAGPNLQFGTLAVQGLYDRKPVRIAPHVSWADWGAGDSTLYYTTIDHKGNAWIEAYSLNTHLTRRIYPSTPISGQQFSYLRVSPRGDMLAFEQLKGMDNGGKVVIIHLADGRPVVSSYFGNIAGLAWTHNDKEVWFTAAKKGSLRSIYAIGVNGRQRFVYQAPVSLTLQDISRNGDVLVTRDFVTSDVYARKLTGTSRNVDLSIFNRSMLGDISDSGKKVAIFAKGNAVSNPSVFLRPTSGGPATNLGDASAPVAISPDGNSLLALTNQKCAQVVLLSTERQPQVLTRSNLCATRAIWVPGGHRIVFDAASAGGKSRGSARCYVQTIGATEAHPFSADGMHCPLVSPDGKFALAQNETALYKISINGSEPPVKIHFQSADIARLRPVRWLKNNKIVITDGSRPELIITDLATGQKRIIPVKVPPYLDDIFSIRVSDNLKTVAFSGYHLKSDLFLIRGLR